MAGPISCGFSPGELFATMEGKWRPELPDRPAFGRARRLSQRWDWFVVGCWVCGLCVCVAFWMLLGLTLSGIDY